MTIAGRTHHVARVARWTLGLVWIYQAVVPKLLASVPLEEEIVRRTGLWLGSPALTIDLVAGVEIALGLWLLSGLRPRVAVLVTSLFLAVLTVLVVAEEPSLLVGPFGGIAKNAALFALAWIVWTLAPGAGVAQGEASR
jgi:uncharacterized membrane protein YphA (DoxX/SURF4 family)